MFFVVFERACYLLTIWHGQHTKSMPLAVFPLSFVGVASDEFKFALTIIESHLPLSVVVGAISVSAFSFAVFLAILCLAFILAISF